MTNPISMRLEIQEFAEGMEMRNRLSVEELAASMTKGQVACFETIGVMLAHAHKQGGIENAERWALDMALTAMRLARLMRQNGSAFAAWNHKGGDG